MSIERYERIPELTLGWRLKMSLGEVTRDEIARVMDVTPSTISRWMAGKGAPPKRPYLVQWAMATSVPVEWLEHGVEPSPTPGPGTRTTPKADRLAQLAASKRSGVSTRRYDLVA